jgi:hypothetical protein
MKSRCPICETDGYDQRTLKEHFLLCHRERPVLVGLILDLLDHVTNLKTPTRETTVHNPTSCVLCRRMAKVETGAR